jgi:hypothetical protein
MVPHAPAAATRPAAADMPREVEFVGNPAHDGSVAVGGQRDRHALSGTPSRAGADQLAALLGPDSPAAGVDPRRPCIGVVSSPACDSGAAVGGQRDGDALPGTPNCADADQLVALLGPDNAAAGVKFVVTGAKVVAVRAVGSWRGSGWQAAGRRRLGG